MTCDAAKKLLASCGQEHVLKYWGSLGSEARKALLKQVSAISAGDTLRCMKALSSKGSAAVSAAGGRAPKVAVPTRALKAKWTAAGEKELRAGRVAALLVAGGQGSRLGYDGPKGAYPIGPLTGRPLFWYHARKILAKKLQYGKSVPWYVMTSEANDADTKRCFKENGYFGLDRRDVFFFTQGMWPCMDSEGRILLKSKGEIATSPDGHGGVLAALSRSGALADMKRRGIRHVFFFQVDNPLVNIADPAFIGFHLLEKSEYSLKLCAKTDPFEKVGVPMAFGKTWRMVEYSEMTKEDALRKAKDGRLYHLYGSPAIHVFDRAFLEREAREDMPLHLAFKKIPCIGKGGRAVKPDSPNGYKFEKFIFDLMPKARKCAFLAFDKAEEFSPLKNATGDDSQETCRRDMMAKWRRALVRSGVEMRDDAVFEVDEALFGPISGE